MGEDNNRNALRGLLEGYATGRLPLALHALAGAHLEICCDHREFVKALEKKTAREDLRHAPSCGISKREDRLAAILDQPPLLRENCCRIAREGWPRALRHYLGAEPASPSFRPLLPGVDECRLPGDSRAEALLYKLRGGAALPRCGGAEGAAFTLVLCGTLLGKKAHYEPGAVLCGASGDVFAAPDQECLCFVVLPNAGERLPAQGRVSRFFSRR